MVILGGRLDSINISLEISIPVSNFVKMRLSNPKGVVNVKTSLIASLVLWRLPL